MSLGKKIMQAALGLTPDRTPDPLIDARRHTGQAVPRVDGVAKVTGAARYAAEVKVADALHAGIVYSAIAKGRIRSLELDAAKAVPGVVLVMTHENAPKMAAPPLANVDAGGASFSNLPVMQDDRIRWNGQAVAVVLAETREAADEAAARVKVTYEADEAATDLDALLHTAKPPKDILGEEPEVKVGDAEQALADAPHRVDAEYRTPRHHQNPIELHAATALWEADGSLTVYDASQFLAGAAASLAKVFGLKPDQVRVRSLFIGGAFGSKLLWTHQILAAAAAKLAGRPVSLVLSREGVFRLVGGRTLTRQRVALGAGADGVLHAVIHTGTTGVVTHNAFPEQFSFPARHLYAAKSFHLAQDVVMLDMVANASMRAPGESVGTFALESAIDELAWGLGLDPIELRRRNEPDADPTAGTPFSSRHLVEAYRAGAERFGWADRAPKPRARREGDWWVGQGVATAYYPYYRMPECFVRLTLAADGTAVVASAAHEIGVGVATIQAQHAADRLGLELAQVRFELGDSALPQASQAGGSSSTVSIAAAIEAAAAQLFKALLKHAKGQLKGLKPDEVRAFEGGLWSVKEPDRGESYVDLLAAAGQDELVVEAEGAPPLEMMKYAMHSYGAQFCEVKVHDLTGEVRVTRWLGSFDAGRMLNPRTAGSQLKGGIIMGIGAALMEEARFDTRSGRFANPSLADYHVPVHLDIPELEVMWTDIPDPQAPLGAHGIGEIGITGAMAAVANAVYHATGQRIRELPLTPARVLGTPVSLP